MKSEIEQKENETKEEKRVQEEIMSNQANLII